MQTKDVENVVFCICVPYMEMCNLHHTLKNTRQHILTLEKIHYHVQNGVPFQTRTDMLNEKNQCHVHSCLDTTSKPHQRPPHLHQTMEISCVPVSN